MDHPIILKKSEVLEAIHNSLIDLPISSFQGQPKPGDELWVCESFRRWRGSASGKTIVYDADDRWIDYGSGENFIDRVTWLTPSTPPSKMPKWASRLRLRVERVEERTVKCSVVIVG